MKVVKRNINESDINRLVSKIILREVAVDDSSKMTIDFTNTFPSAQYEEKYINASEFQDKMKSILQFIKAHSKSELQITVVGGESLVTNPREFSDRGSLATKRCSVMTSKVKQWLSLNNIEFDNIKFTIGQPVIGRTPYQQGDDKNNPKYTQEQFIKVTIEVIGENSQPTWCNSNDTFPGAVGNPANGFLAQYKKYELKGDVGNILVGIDAKEVPDLFVLKYDNQIVHTGFIGNNPGTSYNIQIATILKTVYQGQEMPEHFASFNYSPLSKNAQLQQDFDRWMQDPQDYVEFIKNIEPIGRYIIGAGNAQPPALNLENFPQWNIFKASEYYKRMVWSSMTPGTNRKMKLTRAKDDDHYFEFPFVKKRGVDLFEIWSYGVLGTTLFGVRFRCS